MTFHWHGTFLRNPVKGNKMVEVDIGNWLLGQRDDQITWFCLDVEFRTRCDHGGFHSILVIYNRKFELNFYNRNHWNAKEHRYMTDVEHAAEARSDRVRDEK